MMEGQPLRLSEVMQREPARGSPTEAGNFDAEVCLRTVEGDGPYEAGGESHAIVGNRPCLFRKAGK